MPQPSIAATNIERTSSQIGIDGLTGPPSEREHAVADERADHVDVAVREVQELQDPVDHRVAERDQRVDGCRA